MPLQVGHYQLGNCIGKGAYGVVYKGLSLKDGEVVAVKQISLENVQGVELDSVMSEIELLRRLKHPNIVRYINFFKTEDQLNIILEFAEDGSLTKLFKKSGGVPETIVRDYVRQMLEGLAYLHAQGVVHCDIKCANILKSRDGTIKLTDFGVSTTLKSEEEFKQDVVGTPYWMAPEIIQLEGATTASDIWSLGCTIIELLTCKPPYHDLRSMSALYRIVEDERPPFPSDISADLNDFLLHIFQKNKNHRWTAVQLLQHPFLTEHVKKSTLTNQTVPFFVSASDQTPETLRLAFSLMDKVETGRITFDQLVMLLRSLGSTWDSKEISARIEHLNHQEGFSFDVFEKLVRDSPQMNPQQLQQAFASLDDSGSGLIALSDLKRLVTELGDKLTTSEYDMVRTGMLVDADGRFNYEAWIQSVLNIAGQSR